MYPNKINLPVHFVFLMCQIYPHNPPWPICSWREPVGLVSVDTPL